MSKINLLNLVFFLTLCFQSCKNEERRLFTLTSSDETGIDFINNLPYTEEYNTYTYRNFYNGGGVALGDINNDGLVDIYFTGNIVDNKLYLNKGNWQFEDITSKANVACHDVWSTGATFVDINGDGFLDLYVCKAGKPGGKNRHNELFINQGNQTFVESSHEYGLDIEGLSIQSAFFDYDHDGDLDCYLLNNSLRSVGGFDFKKGQRDIPDADGNKFMRNDNGHFVDVSTEAGIYSSKIGYGLGITLTDINGDNWTDIFISNDFFERDYLYINKGDGTFEESAERYFESLSMGSMGADASDIDNDLLPDIFVTEMLPQTHQRKHTKTQYESWDKYQVAVKNGYHHQFSRNVLQKNLGNKFVEIGRYADVAATEWSWASLIQDYDNDGLKDLFVSNGIYKDLLDKDYLNYFANENMIKSKIQQKEKVLTLLIDSMPSEPIKNCMYKNVGDNQFALVSDDWGLSQLTFSNGSAYGDLDNDGDLDLVVNNANMPSFVYKNNLDTIANRSISIKLKGADHNKQAIGAKVYVYYKGGQSFIENFTSKGFESCMDGTMVIGVGKVEIIDSVKVIWPNDHTSVLTHLQSNKKYELNQNEAETQFRHIIKNSPKNCSTDLIPFVHKELDINLFAKERLTIEMSGYDGPAIAIGDVNGDNRDDVYCGGGKNQPGILYINQGNEKFLPIDSPFDVDYRSEQVKAQFFDSDSDGDLDLYVAHGGKNYSIYAPELNDVLYINNGKGQYSKAENPLSFPYPISTGDFAISDLNHDGKLDIIVVEKMKTSLYGLPGGVVILYNQSNNTFTPKIPKDLENVGMISSVLTSDVNGDSYDDLVLAGKWMPITVVLNQSGTFDHPKIQEIGRSAGLWNSLKKSDLDGDGDDDFICGNEGLNSFYRPNMRMYVQDFDKNGTSEQVICELDQGKYYPIQDIDDLFSQMPFLKKKYLSFTLCAKADMTQLFDKEILDGASKYDIVELQSMVLINNKGNFEMKILPKEIQYSTTQAIFVDSKDKTTQLYLGGNHYQVKPQFGRQDASFGWLVDVEKKGESITFAKPKSLNIDGQIRYIGKLSDKMLFGINNQSIKVCDK